MPNLKTYRVHPETMFDDEFFAVIEIDHEKFDTFALDIVKFWAGWQQELAPDESNKVEIAVARAASFVLWQVANDEHPRACTAAFAQAEGWPSAQEMGLRVVDVGFFDISHTSISVSEVARG
ncbi:hypothetical protein [Microcystis phage vB_MaeS-yong1]|nr:hypothetical protein [Microcystis phage vB_MaeS-yong1]